MLVANDHLVNKEATIAAPLPPRAILARGYLLAVKIP